MLKTLMLIFISISCFAQSRTILNNIEKEFIVRKYVKIQADMDELKYNHKIFQNDSLEYNNKVNFNIPFDVIKNIGLNCFEFDSTGNYTYDVHIIKLNIQGVENKEFDLYSGFLYLDHNYIIAIDDSGKVFPLRGFWTDEFQRFVKNKIANIDNLNKALDLVRIYSAVKFYENGSGIIVDNDNIESIRIQYKNLGSVNKLSPLKIEKVDSYNFKIDTYIYFPADEILNYYNFYISKDGEIDLRAKTVYQNY